MVLCVSPVVMTLQGPFATLAESLAHCIVFSFTNDDTLRLGASHSFISISIIGLQIFRVLESMAIVPYLNPLML